MVPNPKADEDRSERAHGRVQEEGPPLKEEGVRRVCGRGMAWESNLSDETMKNIIIEVEHDKVGFEWLERRGHPLAPTQRDMDLAPTVYAKAVAKFAKVNVHSAETSSALRSSVDVAAFLTDALANLLAIDRSSKPEIVIVFSYDTQGESLYVRPLDVVSLNAQIPREEDNQDEDVFNKPRRVLLAPAIFICNSARFVNVQAFAANSQTQVWSTHRTMYLRSTKRSFRKLVMDPRPVVHLIHCYPTAVD